MRKPTICICENKGADQLRGNREADQRLCFRYTDGTIPLLSKSKFPVSSHLLRLYSPVCVRSVRKPHCLFSHEVAQLIYKIEDNHHMYSENFSCCISITKRFITVTYMN